MYTCCTLTRNQIWANIFVRVFIIIKSELLIRSNNDPPVSIRIGPVIILFIGELKCQLLFLKIRFDRRVHTTSIVRIFGGSTFIFRRKSRKVNTPWEVALLSQQRSIHGGYLLCSDVSLQQLFIKSCGVGSFHCVWIPDKINFYSLNNLVNILMCFLFQ